MNSMFSLRNPVWVIGAMVAFVFSLSACGDDSGSNSGSDENDSFLQVEVFEKLPNCSQNRDGVIAEVLENRKAYVCDNGRWEFDHDILDSVETEDDLPVCLSKNEGNSVWVVDESAVFACIDRKWEKHEKEEPESSSATKKTASSSSEKQEISSSSVKKETSSSSKPLSSSNISQKSSSSVISSSSSVSSSMSSWSGSGAGTIGSITDSRDGQTYKTVTIGTQTWMAQNLNYETANSYCYRDNPNKCTEYGRLYMWAAAISACPSGWHLPTKAEFETLFTAVGGQSTAGKILKSTSGWDDYGDGSDAYSFSALPAGYRSPIGYYFSEGGEANFWSSTESKSDVAYGMNLGCYYDNASLSYNNVKDAGLSVRCVKGEAAEQKSSSSVTPQSSSNETRVSSSSVKSSSSQKRNSSSSEKKLSSSSVAKSSSSFVKSSSSSVAKSSSSSVKSSSSQGSSACSSLIEDGTLTDCRDGQTYKTVTIGSQVWMAENLNYETTSSYCPYGEALYCTNGYYGRLYTWAAAMDSAGTWGTNGKGCGCSKKICRPIYPVRGVCPSGWHLPTSTEWLTLFTAVGGDRKAIEVLRSQTGWAVPIGLEGTDAYGFSALPAGYRHSNGNFYGAYASARFWSATEDFSGDDSARYMDLDYDNERAYLGYSYESFGYSVRCLQD